MLGVNVQYVRRKLIGGRRITYRKLSPRRIVFLPEDVTEFLERCRVVAGGS